MEDLTTKYLGIELKNPIIVGSCSLTEKLADIIKLEEAGAAAVVLKSIFEEEILNEAAHQVVEAGKNKLIYSNNSESLDYNDVHAKGKKLSAYLKLIKDAKKATQIPIIASINCISDSEWIEFASKIQEAGADAIELNISINLMDSQLNKEKVILRIVKKLVKKLSIPIALKLSDRFDHLSHTLIELSNSGIAGLVLFNRFYSPDIDIYNMKLVSGRMLSCDRDYLKPLRSVALFSDKIQCSIAASTGIHDGNTVIKQILAGADAVQVVSALYLNGKDYIIEMLAEIEKWMFEKGMFSINEFKGLASYKNASDPAVYERTQFMKYFGRIEI
jgi:dihydroorotate dehydrogenase (fumarate)